MNCNTSYIKLFWIKLFLIKQYLISWFSDSQQFYAEDINEYRVNFYIERRLEEEFKIKSNKRRLTAPYFNEREAKYMTFDDSKYDIKEPNEDVMTPSRRKLNKKNL